MNLGTHDLLTREGVPWKKETHLPIFESGHVSSHRTIFLSRFILSFCVNFYVPLPKLNMKPWKKKIMASKFGIWKVLPFEKPFFYSLHPWTLAWENCVLNGWGKNWSFFLTRLPEFCPSQLVCLQNFGPWTTIFLSSMLIGTFVSLYVTWCNINMM